ncbi:Dot/Icm T4SS effector AnkK/LegA5 [Legionella cardiaca]|uniref:Substrate of the Dot/Icm secretion system n=1 Tax=Legionella cardiaca TaxID=1071983 RepID=A0ABY8ARJ4_9GAMM|nr:Dot/Icm T4SS effector AnkK/LegA5 [Legionella cardiaca]WED43293.1 hypothetical protein PXX05_00515 [Legionella cardiaca]
MPRRYFLEHILGLDKSKASKTSAHAVHFVDYRFGAQTIPIVYKENKHGKPLASVRETTFSELARLIMKPHLTPPQHLVVNEDNQIVGTAVDNIKLSIAQREKIGETQFYNLTPHNYLSDLATNHALTKEISFNFLNQMPNGFFAHLMTQKAKRNLSIDMESLASVLTCSYALEEDDLHKGNIGFYIVKKNGKPHVVFFKIDHDLLLTESITSFVDSRLQNWINRENNFDITTHDLIHFPDLRDSENFYWPTRKRFFVKLGDDKVYSHYEDREAFKKLQKDKDFVRYKWKQLLKDILIPDELIRESLFIHLEDSNFNDISEVNLVSQAMSERMAKLKSVLFSIPAFYEYLNSEPGQQDLQDNIKELVSHMEEVFPEAKRKTLKNSMHLLMEEKANFYLAAASGLSSARGSPLHASIRLGDYRFEKSDKKFIHTRDHLGNLPIDIAFQQAQTYIPHSETMHPGQDPIFVIKHLLERGARMTPQIDSFFKSKSIDITSYQFNSQYLNWPLEDYADLKATLTAIGGDNTLTLKTKKIIAAQVTQNCIHRLSPSDLNTFKNDLNGAIGHPRASELLYISQLRSSFWLIRILFGLYGNSSTKKELNSMIQQAQKKTLNKSHLSQFFTSASNSEPVSEQEQDNSDSKTYER